MTSHVRINNDAVEIYGLYCPETGELRYVGKAKDTAKRLTKHIQERGLKRPVNNWIRSLVERGLKPRAEVLEVVPLLHWEEAERKWIAHYRQTSNLLNLADGGAMPSQTAEQRKAAARAANKAVKANPALAAANRYKRDMGKMLSDALRRKDYSWAAQIRFLMRIDAAGNPTLYGAWASA